MADSWPSLCRDKALQRDGDKIVVELGEDRRHRLLIEESEDSLLLRAVVLGPKTMATSGVDMTRIWEMNRSLTLVGFRLDKDGRLIGEAVIPRIGLTPEEFATVAKNLAMECDRYEYILTGKDVE